MALRHGSEAVHQAILASRPVWLFSVGLLGSEVKDAEPQPKEMAQFQQMLSPREHRVFFGLERRRLPL